MARLVFLQGKLFLLGNIYGRDLPEEITPFQSRNSLSMIEIDTDSLTPVEKTLTVIDERSPENNPSLALSNFTLLHDRERGGILIACPMVFAHQETLTDCRLMLYHVTPTGNQENELSS